MKYFCIIACALLFSSASQAGRLTLTPELGLELRYFPDSPVYENQFSDEQSSLILSVDSRWISDDRKKRVRFEPFFRWDSRDGERTHGDIRELSYTQRFDDFDLFAGVGQIFWGVAESRNVVDVINQFDTVENSDETDKLGQPLVRLGKFTDYGRFELYYLPYFRERTFPGVEGRQRTALTVDTDNVRYERSGDEYAGDLALRYKHQLDKFDVGAHVFYGTNRAPFFAVNDDVTRLLPFYQKLVQGGVDIQWTSDAWLLKFEAVGARSGGDTYFSTVAGFEYTFFGVRQSSIDIGLLLEGLYDSRDEEKTALTLFENDVFVGSRITWNDVAESELLFGGIVDVETGAAFGSLEFETRLGSNYLFETEAQVLSSPEDDPLVQLERDSNLTLRLTRFF